MIGDVIGAARDLIALARESVALRGERLRSRLASAIRIAKQERARRVAGDIARAADKAAKEARGKP